MSLPRISFPTVEAATEALKRVNESCISLDFWRDGGITTALQAEPIEEEGLFYLIVPEGYEQFFTVEELTRISYDS